MLLLLVTGGSLIGMMSLDPIPQDPDYHAFADDRTFLGIPNCFDVLSNLPFLVVGIMGLLFCRRASLGAVHVAWAVFFVGVTFVSVGSGYYHVKPDSTTLVWDRLPMTIAFMGLFVALLGEHVGPRLAKLLWPAIGVGLATVVYWHISDDLRPYLWVQLVPLLTIPALMFMYPTGRSHQWLLGVALGWYVLAKVTELYDPDIFHFVGETVSGHSIKHVSAAVGCYTVLVMLRKRSAAIAR